ncbi:MGMT family protein [Aspergillus clavatus NRRL 1]|uniref:Methylated-DNA--protein-cysteine methyltransferase n=1 Tax=Aspergillus clavatus (strain ATCC 1007 / CBS 513.65 / DSM 816 / NCTC 3887 / NRRL 1 / QM 1276 / 107) TaxID=344612 RepID=A1CFC7_ASPCL|nr:6-O-methylguanine DNA methyltransferase, DNA binding domain protein [Aspergillus clavatus NRRL 1]EAW11576.1 6-O-methylguanine DNA methyltransferase, DNA binding domain protein [Aspergillus clavatus NRRL 1]
MATQEQTTDPTPTASPSQSLSLPVPLSPKPEPKLRAKQTQPTLATPLAAPAAPAAPLDRLLTRITTHPTLTPTRRRIYRTLLSVPAGRWTTYAALATYVGTSARAVGGAMRANPFAPGVPCHRVLAADGSLGGKSKGKT